MGLRRVNDVPLSFDEAVELGLSLIEKNKEICKMKEILCIPVCKNCGKKQMKLTNHIYESCDVCHGELEMKRYKEMI